MRRSSRVGPEEFSNSNSTSQPEPARETQFNMEGKTIYMAIVGVVVAVIVLLVVILVPASYSALEYYQFGFKRRTTTGTVDTETVYDSGGLHLIGPDYEFKKFPSDAHFERFNRITVFASDRLQVTISCSLQYFLRKEQLHLLHEQFDIHYKPVLQRNLQDAIKGAATSFSTREFIHNREEVEAALFHAVRERLGGICCEKDCERGGHLPCAANCKRYSACTVNDMGHFAEVRYFQLLELGIPTELNGRYLESLVLQELADTEKLRQQATIIRKETDQKCEQTINTAREVSQNATAQSGLIAARAAATAIATVERARSDGLKTLYDEIGITDPEQMASFDYLRTLRRQNNVQFNVDFQQLIAGGLG